MRKIRSGLAIAALAAMQGTLAQDWTRLPGGNVITANEWLGADVGSTIPLQIRHDANQPIEWYTAALNHMRLNNTVTTTINGYGATAKDGFLGLSPNGGLWTTGPGAYSRLHLDDGIFPPLTGPYRPWMRNGVYMSGNNDMMYVGQLFRAGEDERDAMVARNEGGEAEEVADGVAGHGAN
ncbi:MAG: hypothetical protein IPP83_01020 [Flavobacteriales bacterium]|nr:hypothetical protein [Flavobacteriales bacterium]